MRIRISPTRFGRSDVPAVPFGVVLVAFVAIVGTVRSAEPKPEAAVRSVLDSQVEAWNRGDLEGFMAGYWKSDELTFFSGGDVTKGWDATIARYRKRYQADGKEMGKLTFADVEVTPIGGKDAMVRGRWKVVTSKETFEGLFTLRCRKLEEGWKIVHDHTSAADPPKKPEAKKE